MLVFTKRQLVLIALISIVSCVQEDEETVNKLGANDGMPEDQYNLEDSVATSRASAFIWTSVTIYVAFLCSLVYYILTNYWLLRELPRWKGELK